MGALRLEDLPRYCYDDYKHWEDKWELIYGVAYAMSPMPMIKHQRISSNIDWQLKELLKNCQKCIVLLPVDWKIDEETVVQPDNLVICYEPKHESYITKAPKIIFEVLSKSTAHKDLNIKYSLYEKEGVLHYVIVNPDDNLAKVYHLENGKYIKVIDAIDESVKFNLENCEIEFDFSKIW